ncbi:MAG: TolC family protein [Bacteroidales bacterium]
MKKTIISILFSVIVFHQIMAQMDYKNILAEIETNSTMLGALKHQMEADKLAYRTGIYLANPEVEFNYLWGNTPNIGNRQDINISQTFDFPSVYLLRNRVADMQNQNIELLYKAERINLLLSAKQLLIQLVYYNSLEGEYKNRLSNAERIAKSYRIRIEKGDANAIENNKAQMNLIMVQNQLNDIRIQQVSLLSQLKSLNGGKELSFNQNAYYSLSLPASFQEWYLLAEMQNPTLQYVRMQVEISRQQIKLNQVLSLPKFKAGYMSEKIIGEHFQGVSLGISIPMFENKNTVKQAKAKAVALEAQFEDNRVRFYNNLQALYFKAHGLQENAEKYRRALSTFSNADLLQKALDGGEMDLLQYLLEIEYYYEIMNKVLEAEREYQLTLSELSAVQL